MAELRAAEGELKAVIHVTRKDTGKTETYEVVGKVNHDEMQALLQSEQKEVKE